MLSQYFFVYGQHDLRCIKKYKVNVGLCSLSTTWSLVLQHHDFAQLSALDCPTASRSTCQRLWAVGMTSHAAAHYYTPLLLIMYVFGSVNYCRLHTSTKASVQSSPQPLCLKCKPGCLCVTNTTECLSHISVHAEHLKLSNMEPNMFCNLQIPTN